MNSSRLLPVEAAKRFITEKFPDCQAALLAGSVVRGEATATSDLDVVVFDEKVDSAYRESLIEYGWPIEVFVHNFTSYKAFFKEDCEGAQPSLPRMVSEGFILSDSGVLSLIKEEANELLKKGPEVWSIETIEMKRYMVTDALDDLIGSTKRAEELFIANTLAYVIHEFVLRTNVQWIGSSKWIVRALNQFDKNFAQTFVQAFDLFYKTGRKDGIIALTNEVLEPHGGRLFEGYSRGKSSEKGERI
ncbi:nucleotidyltransferase domain-containing protein [Sporosarcina sp. ANT_H38]|uniref:nucleotidyltransferase domain-containing protein n=1 Tax=Sporosarcina sp. ANT_H38 TaxID=2597358 RepID=UPI0011F1EB1E|nr:nucleotidyltransferase domain-containing protein [Sporosarcina sp. ANT_H38]KAA0948532.1 nucleotidyltransferase domain-containing protein [Sporosarcina sp. ANT_H38]